MDTLLKIIMSFIIGGLICAAVQVIIDLTKLTPARIMVFRVVLGVILGGTGIYKFLFDFSGAGVSVPLLGFGAVIAKGVGEAVDKFGLLGILKGPLAAASAGCASALFLGFLSSLFFKGKPKRTK